MFKVEDSKVWSARAHPIGGYQWPVIPVNDLLHPDKMVSKLDSMRSTGPDRWSERSMASLIDGTVLALHPDLREEYFAALLLAFPEHRISSKDKDVVYHNWKFGYENWPIKDPSRADVMHMTVHPVIFGHVPREHATRRIIVLNVSVCLVEGFREAFDVWVGRRSAPKKPRRPKKERWHT